MTGALRRFLLIMAVAATALGLGVAKAQEEVTLRIGTGAELSSLDPRVATDIPSFERIYAILEPLVTFAHDLSLEPRLAADWELSEDGLTLSFELREGVMWHHGREFTSEDVRYTFEWVLDPENDAPNRALYEDIDTIETPDDYTVVFNLSEPNSFLLNNIARMPVVPYDLGDDPGFGSEPVGTGPYMFESLVRDDRLVLRAFDDYWGGRGQVDVVEFRPIPEDATRLLAFEAGEIDLSQSQPVPAELERLEEDERFMVERTPGTGYTYLGFNTRVETLDDVRVRQAISHLIDRDAVVDQILEGIGQPGISMIIPEMPWFNPDVTRFDYDPERAAELLAEAGVEEGVNLRLYTNENPIRIFVAEILQAELANLGINLEVNIEEFGAFLSRVQDTDDYDMFILGWGGQLDPDRAMIRQFTTEGPANYTYYSNERVDELVTRGRVIPTDSPESIEVYQEAQAIVVEEVPYAFVFYTEEIAFYHPYVEGFNVHSYGSVPYQDLHEVTINR